MIYTNIECYGIIQNLFWKYYIQQKSMINHMIPVVPVLSYGYLPDPNFSSIKISLANNNRCQNDTTFNTTINRKDFASNLIKYQPGLARYIGKYQTQDYYQEDIGILSPEKLINPIIQMTKKKHDQHVQTDGTNDIIKGIIQTVKKPQKPIDPFQQQKQPTIWPFPIPFTKPQPQTKPRHQIQRAIIENFSPIKKKEPKYPEQRQREKMKLPNNCNCRKDSCPVCIRIMKNNIMNEAMSRQKSSQIINKATQLYNDHIYGKCWRKKN